MLCNGHLLLLLLALAPLASEASLALTLAASKGPLVVRGREAPGGVSAGGSGVGSASVEGSANLGVNLPAGAMAGQQLDAATLFDLGLSPVQSGLKLVLPNAYQGLTSDLNNNYQMLSNGAAKGYSSLQSGLGSLGDSAYNRFQSMGSNLSSGMGAGINKYQQMSSDEVVRRLYEMVSNPQQICRQLGQQAQQVSAQSSGSLMNKLGSGFSFGWK